MERLSESSPDAYLADLAYHFYEAGAWEKALEYGQRAGEQAQGLYAPHTAIEQLTRALDAAQRGSIPPPASLYRLRGPVHETLGDFEQARLDYATTLQMAQRDGDRRAEWQALCDLGFLWTGRDYARAGSYFQQALALARQMDDPLTLAVTVMSSIGDRLGLFKNLAQQGPATSEELAERAHINERYAREWLSAMASAGYVEYDPATRRFTLPPEHVPVLAQEGGPVFFGGVQEEMVGLAGPINQLMQAFTRGLSITTFRYVPPDLTPGSEEVEAYLNQVNAELLTRLQRSGEAFLSNAVMRGTFLLRACVVNFCTCLEDIEALPGIVMRIGREVDAAIRPVNLNT